MHPYLKSSGYPEFSKESPLHQDYHVDIILEKVKKVLKRIHVLVVGPGLGRDPVMLDIAAKVIMEAVDLQIPLIIDAVCAVCRFIIHYAEKKTIETCVFAVILHQNEG